MIETLDTITLETGERMAVKVITPPASEYTDRLCHFLEHKRTSFRDIQQRLRGDYSEYCVDKYFVGEINDTIVSQLWYGYTESGVGNFGHVYTEPEHRKKGITKHLMTYFLDDFNRSKAEIILCATGTPWVANIYLGYGFQTVINGAEKGPLMLLKQNNRKCFKEVEEEYFKPGQELEILDGTMQYRHDIDKMLMNALLVRDVAWLRIMSAFHVNTYRDAIHLSEDGKGINVVAKTGRNTIAGWAFAVNAGSAAEDKSKTFDFVIHPNYEAEAGMLVTGALAMAVNQGIDTLFAYIPQADMARLDTLAQAGFESMATIPQYCIVDGVSSDAVIMRKELN